MSTARFNAYLKKINPGERVRRAVSAARLNSLGTLAKEAASGTFISGGPGVRMQHGPNGCTISVKRSTQWGGLKQHPFYILSSGEIMVGTVNGVIPKYGTHFIGIGGPELDFSGLEDGYVYIEVPITVTYAYEWFESFEVVGDIKIIGSSTTKTDTSTKVYYLVAQVVAGVVIHPQPCTHNMQFVMCASSKNEAHASWTSAS